MIKKLLLPILIFILLSSFASAVEPNLQHRFNLNAHGDLITSNVLTNVGSGNSLLFPIYNQSGNSSPNSSVFGSNYMYDETNDDYQTGNNFSISYWLYPTSLNVWNAPVGFRGDYSTNTGDFIQALFSSTGFYEFYLNDGSFDTPCTTSAGVISVNKWHHVVIDYDGSNKRVYINNSLKCTQASTKTVSTNDIVIGAINKNPTYPVNGNIDEVKVYNKSLNSTERSNLFNFGTILGNVSVINNFSITAVSDYSGASINNFSADVNGTIYNTTNGTIITGLLDNNTNLFNITLFDSNWYNRTYENYDLSADLVGELNQTDIRFRFQFNTGDLLPLPTNLSIIDLNNSLNFTSNNSFLNFSPIADESITFSISCDNEIFAPFNLTISFSALQNETINITVNETQNVLTFLDANTSSPLNDTNVTIHFPSGFNLSLMTNVSGQVSFSYIQNNITEFGSYVFEVNKIGYVAINISETINGSDVPFFQTYNLSRAKLTINIYDRVTRVLLSGVNVSVAFIGLFNETTLTGTIVKDNLTIIGGDYLIYAASDGYKTSVRSLTFTNQEEFTLDFYLLNLSYPTYGTLFVTTFDSFYRDITGAKVELLEYIPSSLSYVSVDECVSNINAQCSFGVELNTKVYFIRATAIIDGVLLIAETSRNGEIFTVNGDNRDLVFYTSTSFEVEPSSRLIYEISETFVNNVSSISNNFYSLDGGAIEVCIEYFKDGVSVTGDTYCLSSTSAIQNVDTNILLNRSNDYVAEIYIKTDNGNILLKKYVYPSVNDITGVLGDSIVGAIILVLWMFALGFCVYSSNMVLWFSLALVLAWLQVIFFPSNSIVSFAVFKSLISVLCLLVARKKRDVV